MKKNILITIVILVLVFIGVAVYFIYNNTHFLRPPPTEEQIAENNFNEQAIVNINIATNTNEVVDTNDYLTLVSKKLSVPEKFRQGVFSQDRNLNLPEIFSISVFAAGLDAPRFFTFDSENNLIVADKKLGQIILLPDSDQDGVADDRIVIDQGLQVMHSVFFYQGDLYAAEEDKVSVYRSLKPDGSYDSKEILISSLPSDGGHSTRTIVIGPDDKIYLSVGSSCNLCEEKDSRRAAVVRYSLDGSDQEVFASGLRNSVGIEFRDDVLWSVNNGRDRIGDDIPPEKINIVEQGKHYGWPYCYGDGIVNPEYVGEKENFCQNETVFPAYQMQAHSAPLGMAFVPEVSATQKVIMPNFFSNDMFIGFHGSWNRTVPTGYKVVRIDTSSPDSQTINFITGWLDSSGTVWGRPVDVGFDQEGVMYVSDDKAGAIYRVVLK